MTTLSAHDVLRRIGIRSLGALMMLTVNAACAAGPGRAAREESRRLTCPLERVGTVRNFDARPVDVFALRIQPWPKERNRTTDMIGSVNPGQTAEFVLQDSVILTWSEPTGESRSRVPWSVHAVAASPPVEVTYECRGVGDAPPAAEARR